MTVVDDAPATPQQVAMLVNAANSLQPTVFNVPTKITLVGDLDIDALEAALGEVISRHGALRCRFVNEGGWRQKVLAPQPFRLRCEDVQAEHVDEICHMLANEPFDLAETTLPVCRLMRVDTDTWVLMLVMHHIAVDGWALTLVLQELAQLYGGAALAPPGAQCTDYGRWLHHNPQVDARKMAFWRDYLDGVPLAPSMPTDRPRPERMSGQGTTALDHVSGTTRAAVEALASARRTTPFSVLAAALAVRLAQLSGERKIAFAVSYANRERREFESMVSCTRVAVIVRVIVNETMTFGELVSHAAVAVLEAIANALPMDLVVTEQPSVALAFMNYQDKEISFAGVDTVVEDMTAAGARRDQTVGLFQKADGYLAFLEHSTDLWDPKTGEDLLTGYTGLLADLCAEPDRPALWDHPTTHPLR
ncbi:condensation domain-containing protein [Actinocrispum wychmicini]|uniref:Condensation domain-containing protein n=1 Tax=Actinocrispum wychmicini TaxID=1213861 RepID=A0A4R2JPI1_9PSEU|nr:condensation domain-containing protein [Actinocrispum wychmicini]TCO60672.1 condensation domain-containing protein [Actinocrispum wychmicini]